MNANERYRPPWPMPSQPVDRENQTSLARALPPNRGAPPDPSSASPEAVTPTRWGDFRPRRPQREVESNWRTEVRDRLATGREVGEAGGEFRPPGKRCFTVLNEQGDAGQLYAGKNHPAENGSLRRSAKQVIARWRTLQPESPPVREVSTAEPRPATRVANEVIVERFAWSPQDRPREVAMKTPTTRDDVRTGQGPPTEVGAISRRVGRHGRPPGVREGTTAARGAPEPELRHPPWRLRRIGVRAGPEADCLQFRPPPKRAGPPPRAHPPGESRLEGLCPREPRRSIVPRLHEHKEVRHEAVKRRRWTVLQRGSPPATAPPREHRGIRKYCLPRLHVQSSGDDFHGRRGETAPRRSPATRRAFAKRPSGHGVIARTVQAASVPRKTNLAIK